MLMMLGKIFIIIIVSGLLYSSRFISGNDFLINFINNNSPGVMGTILALNIATASFLIGHLTNIEMALHKACFKKSRKELKHNIVSMLCVYPLQLLILSFSPDINSHPVIYGVLSYVSVFFFVFYIYALFEIATAIFSLDKIVEDR